MSDHTDACAEDYKKHTEMHGETSWALFLNIWLKGYLAACKQRLGELKAGQPAPKVRQ